MDMMSSIVTTMYQVSFLPYLLGELLLLQKEIQELNVGKIDVTGDIAYIKQDSIHLELIIINLSKSPVVMSRWDGKIFGRKWFY